MLMPFPTVLSVYVVTAKTCCQKSIRNARTDAEFAVDVPCSSSSWKVPIIPWAEQQNRNPNYLITWWLKGRKMGSQHQLYMTLPPGVDQTVWLHNSGTSWLSETTCCNDSALTTMGIGSDRHWFLSLRSGPFCKNCMTRWAILESTRPSTKSGNHFTGPNSALMWLLRTGLCHLGKDQGQEQTWPCPNANYYSWISWTESCNGPNGARSTSWLLYRIISNIGATLI